ncbi:MAG: UbiA prenyltransferase family protein [Acidimicrobiales bacterium]|nr:UbiA prenyltransferase family protein [Acidimicrobiales bacterium]
MRGAWAGLVRPVALVPVGVVAFLFGALGAGRVPPWPEVLRLVLFAGLLVSVSLGADTLNQVADLHQDVLNWQNRKDQRPMPSGLLSPVNTLSAVVTGWFVVLVVGALTLPATTVVLLLLVVLASWGYSMPPIRAKDRFPLNLAYLSAPRGAFGVAAAWTVYGGLLDPHLLALIAALVPFILLAQSSKDIGDREADLATGTATVATLWGETAARRVTMAGLCWPIAAVGLLSMWRWDPYLLLLAVPAVVGLWGCPRWAPQRVWALFYATLGLVAVLAFLPLVV